MWQSITLPLRHPSSTVVVEVVEVLVVVVVVVVVVEIVVVVVVEIVEVVIFIYLGLNNERLITFNKWFIGFDYLQYNITHLDYQPLS